MNVKQCFGVSKFKQQVTPIYLKETQVKKSVTSLDIPNSAKALIKMPIWPQLAILQLKWRENSNVSKVGKIQINYKYFSTQSVPTTAKFMDVSSIQAAPGTGCPKCGGEVFHAERMFSKGRTYHKACFTCENGSCKRPLDSVSVCDTPNGNIYCKGCYGKTFGAKGYGFGGGAGFLQCGNA